MRKTFADSQEIGGLQRRSSDQAAVHVLFGEEFRGVRRFAGTSVEDRSFIGRRTEFLAQDRADVGVDFLCLLCRRGLARADGPDGLVGDYGSGELGRREVVDNLFDLCLYYVEVAVRFAFLEVLAHAVDRLQTVGECLRHLLLSVAEVSP